MSLAQYSLAVQNRGLKQTPIITFQTATTTLFITVTDINDNSPIFDQPSYMFTVQENRLNEFVGTVRAVDVDSGISGEIVYSVPFSNGYVWVELVTCECVSV